MLRNIDVEGKCGLVFLFLHPETSTSNPTRQRMPPGDSGCQEGECVPGLQTLLVHPSFVPRLAGVLPPLQLRVWKGQQGQHGEGKEGRLCPARPPGCPEGKGAWRAVEQRKRGCLTCRNMELAEDKLRERDRTGVRQIPYGVEDSLLSVELQAYKLYTLRVMMTGSEPAIDECSPGEQD
eukprot:superscaffoldBa00000020_g417